MLLRQARFSDRIQAIPTTQPVLYDASRADRIKELDGLPLASFRSRAVALLIDFLIAGGLFMGVGISAIVLLNKVPVLREWNQKHNFTLDLNFFHNWYSVVYLVVFFGLSLYWGRGRTLGKRLMKIRVVPLHHDRLSLWNCVERALGYGASTLEFGFGFFQYFIHPNRQTVHDRIAETIVVDERKR